MIYKSLKLIIKFVLLTQFCCMIQSVNAQYVKVSEFCLYNTSAEELKCEHFKSHHDLKFAKFGKDLKIKTLSLKPSEKIEINNDLTIEIDSISKSFQENYTVYLNNFDSFNLLENPFGRIKSDGLKLFLSDLRIEFKINQQNINLNCNLNAILTTYLFSTFKEIYFNADIIYPSDLCPLAFRGVTLEILEFKSLSLNENKLAFSELGPSNNNRLLNSNIKKLSIIESDLTSLDSSILNKDVFKSVSSIFYSNSDPSQVLNISADLLVHLINWRTLS